VKMRRIKIAARPPLAREGPYTALVGVSTAARSIGWAGLVIGFSWPERKSTVKTQMWCLTPRDAIRIGNALLAAAEEI